jgi:hypothetical protein
MTTALMRKPAIAKGAESDGARPMSSMSGIPVHQPPKKSTTATAETRYMAAYSERKKRPKRMPVYSVWKPETSSDSASGRSKGARLHSARLATR